MELPSRGSREPNRSEKRRGLEPTRSAVEHWIARARQSFVENLHHSETARSLVVRSSGRPGPNVKAQLDPMVAGRRDLPCAQRCLTDVDRGSGLRQAT